MASRAMDIDADIAFFNLNFDILVSLWQHNHLGGGRMDASICFGDGDTLDTMGPAFVFHATVDILPPDDERHVFNSALFRLISVKYLDFPTSSIGIAAIHAIQFACEKCGLITASSTLNRDDSIFLIHFIFGQERDLDLFEQLLFMNFEAFEFFKSEFAYLQVIAVVHFLGLSDLLVICDQLLILLH